jgi:hypothetical protein
MAFLIRRPDGNNSVVRTVNGPRLGPTGSRNMAGALRYFVQEQKPRASISSALHPIPNTSLSLRESQPGIQHPLIGDLSLFR